MKIGDRVKFVSDTGVGRVVKINGSMVDVDIEDGFIMPCMITELVVVQEEDEIAAIKSIGVGDERPGTKKAKPALKEKKKEALKGKKEPAYAKYGKISLISEYRDEEDDSAEEGDDDLDDIDMNRIHEIYLRNKAAEELREREFEEARERQQKAKQMITESSEPVVEVESEKKLESTTLEELAAKLKLDLPKPVVESKEKKSSDVEVIDLHAKEILEVSEKMTNGEILSAQLARFVLSCDLAIKSGKHGKMVFIHGVGSGKLKMEMQKILKTKYPKIAYQDASFKEYGYGAILIFY